MHTIQRVGTRDVIIKPSPVAMVWNSPDRPHDALASPGVRLSPGEALVEVELATICGADVRTIGGVDATTAPQVTVAPAVDIPLAVELDDSFGVNWLTSCGTMHDFDLAHAYLRVEPEDPQSGSLAVVVRDTLGGVAWHTWPIVTE